LLVFRLVEGVVGDNSTEVVWGTSVVESDADRYGHKLRVPHVLGCNGV
jgi:hypothetical protein